MDERENPISEPDKYDQDSSDGEGPMNVEDQIHSYESARAEHTDILQRLVDLQKQATTERSHYYVAAVCTDAIKEIADLRRKSMDAYLAGLEDAREISNKYRPHQWAVTVANAIEAKVKEWAAKK